MKLCIDCVHYKDKAHSCGKDELEMISPVTGKSYRYNMKTCETERIDATLVSWITGTCGKNGRFFVPKKAF